MIVIGKKYLIFNSTNKYIFLSFNMFFNKTQTKKTKKKHGFFYGKSLFLTEFYIIEHADELNGLTAPLK